MIRNRMHRFKVNNAGNSAYLELTYVTSLNPLKEQTLGYYPYVSYIKKAAERYFKNTYKINMFDQYTILWPKKISWVCKDEEV